LYLREISLAIFRPDYEREIYLRAAEHIALIFMRFLRPKFRLDGLVKTNITLGRVEGEPKYSRLLNVNQYYFEGFDFDAYDAASPEERDSLILDAIERSLLDIAQRHGSELEPIRRAAAATRECGFDLRGYTKLSRFTPSRKLQIKVFQRVSREGIEWGIDVASAKGVLLQTFAITRKTDAWRSAHDYRKSRWDGECFVILDFLGMPQYTLNVATLAHTAE